MTFIENEHIRLQTVKQKGWITGAWHLWNALQTTAALLRETTGLFWRSLTFFWKAKLILATHWNKNKNLFGMNIFFVDFSAF